MWSPTFSPGTTDCGQQYPVIVSRAMVRLYRHREAATSNGRTAAMTRARRRSGGLLLERGDHQQPGRRDHVTGIGDDGDGHDVKTEGMPEEIEGRADHLG